MLIPSWQKLIAILLYMLPWSDALPFGRYLFLEVPIFNYFAIPALPIFFIEKSIPFGGFIIFLGLFLGIVRNQNIPYFIRFNTLQAILIDIGIILISYFFQIILSPLGNGLTLRTLCSTILIGCLAIVIFAIIECIQGKEADLPGISNAVRMQL